MEINIRGIARPIDKETIRELESVISGMGEDKIRIGFYLVCVVGYLVPLLSFGLNSEYGVFGTCFMAIPYAILTGILLGPRRGILVRLICWALRVGPGRGLGCIGFIALVLPSFAVPGILALASSGVGDVIGDPSKGFPSYGKFLFLIFFGLLCWYYLQIRSFYKVYTHGSYLLDLAVRWNSALESCFSGSGDISSLVYVQDVLSAGSKRASLVVTSIAPSSGRESKLSVFPSDFSLPERGVVGVDGFDRVKIVFEASELEGIAALINGNVPIGARSAPTASGVDTVGTDLSHDKYHDKPWEG